MVNIFDKLSPKIAHKPFQPNDKTNTFIMSTVPLGVLSLFTNIEYICGLFFVRFIFQLLFSSSSSSMCSVFILHTFISLIFQLLFLLCCIPGLLCDFCFSYASQVSHNLQITHATSSFNSFVMSSSYCFHSITRERWMSIGIIICSMAFAKKKNNIQVFQDV